MALYDNLRDYRCLRETDDVRGADICGADDEKLGKIDDVIFDQTNGDLRYVVVDAGGWLHTRKFLVPALDITIREEGDQDFHVDMTKEQIERLPEYKEGDLESEALWTNYEKSYAGAITDGSVLQREGSTHLITPPPEAQPQSAGSLVGNVDRGPRRAEGEYNGIDALLPPLQKEEPITMSRAEFLKEGTLRSEYDAPLDAPDGNQLLNQAEGDNMDSGIVAVTDISHHTPEVRSRFSAFQERLRHEREEILRQRNKKDELTKEDRESRNDEAA